MIVHTWNHSNPIVFTFRVQSSQLQIPRSEALISVDGGIYGGTAPLVIAAGVDMIVTASFLFKLPEGPAGGMAELRALAAKRG